MSETSTLSQQAETVRKETISILENLNDKGTQFELPKPPEEFDRYRQRLQQNTYKILVVGEAKRGKSTFVNALIGQQILPTDVEVATSQVFNVRRIEQEDYRLRYEDDSVQEIAVGDLSRYGSQVAENRGERPKLGETIRWIEVDMPSIRFLPKGVSLLDTPGTGGLYAQHALITYRFVPEADAVIFVLSSEQPMLQTEVEFLERILGVTSDVFFIQTKTDLFSEEAWRDILRRNEQILKDKFGDRLTDTRIWPINSKLLLEAPSPEEDQEGFEEDLKDSMYEDVEAAMRTFLFQVAGWRRSAEAIVGAGRYHATARATLSTRLDALTKEEGKLEEMKRRAQSRREEFEADWSRQGRRRKELVEGIRRTAAQGRKSIREALQPGGRIPAVQREKIEVVESVDEAKRLNKAMADEVAMAIMSEWDEVGKLAQERCSELLGPFLEEADALNALQEDQGDPPIAIGGTELRETQDRLSDKIMGLFSGGRLGYMLGIGVLVVTSSVLAAGALVVWGAFSGWRSVKERQLKSAKAELRKNLDTVLQEAKRQLLEVDMQSGRDGAVDEFFATLERDMLAQVEKIAKQKEKEARAEYARLMEAGTLDDQQRQQREGQAKGQLDEWDALGKAVEGVSARLNALDQAPAVASPATR